GSWLTASRREWIDDGIHPAIQLPARADIRNRLVHQINPLPGGLKGKLMSGAQADVLLVGQRAAAAVGRRGNGEPRRRYHRIPGVGIGARLAEIENYQPQIIAREVAQLREA